MSKNTLDAKPIVKQLQRLVETTTCYKLPLRYEYSKIKKCERIHNHLTIILDTLEDEKGPDLHRAVALAKMILKDYPDAVFSRIRFEDPCWQGPLNRCL